MMTKVAIVLVVLWLLGLLTHTLGGWIHVLLVVAIVLFVMGMMKGKSQSPM